MVFRLKMVEPKFKDPRYQEFLAAIKDGYERRHWGFGWGDPDGKQLKALLTEQKSWNVLQFRRCMKNYFDSEGSIPGDQPRCYLRKLPRYWAGPLNQYGKLIEHKTARHEVLEV